MTKLQQHIAGALALVVLLTLAYCRGLEKGRTDEKLSINSEQLKSSDDSIKVLAVKVSSAKVKTDKAEIVYRGIRDRVRVVRDTVFVKGENSNDSVTIVSPAIAQLIRAADSTIAAQKRSLELQDVLTRSLYADRSLRNERIAILETKKSPRLGFKSGVVVGAGIIIGALVLAR